MRGFFAIAKSMAFMPTMARNTQKVRVQFRLANQLLGSQFRMCSTLATLRMANLFGAFSDTLPEEGEGTLQVITVENDIEATISRILSVTLKSNMVVQR